MHYQKTTFCASRALGSELGCDPLVTERVGGQWGFRVSEAAQVVHKCFLPDGLKKKETKPNILDWIGKYSIYILLLKGFRVYGGRNREIISDLQIWKKTVGARTAIAMEKSFCKPYNAFPYFCLSFSLTENYALDVQGYLHA